MTIKYLSQFDLLQIRTKLQARLGTSFPTMDLDRLQGALAAPRQVVFGHELHATLWDKAAVLVTRLIVNHPFYDGNKRVAAAAVREFLRRNGYELAADESSVNAITRQIVAGEIDIAALSAWLERHARRVA
jgi:death-on-curing protein